MEQSAHQVSTSMPLDRFVACAFSELEKLRYSRRSLRRYRTIWRHLVAFSYETNLGDEYSADLAAQFCNAHYADVGTMPTCMWKSAAEAVIARTRSA